MASEITFEAIGEIEAKFVLADGFLEILVGGGKETSIDVNGARPPTRRIRGAGEHEELGLKGKGKFADSSRKNAAPSRLRGGLFSGDGAGEGAAFVAEEFAFRSDSV